jgi:hypothetical protein
VWELAYVVAVVVLEPERTIEAEDAVEERGINTLLELELELERELAAAVEGELTALSGMVAMMLGMGSMWKMSLELLQQARLPGPRPWVSQQLEEEVSYTLHTASYFEAYYWSLVKIPPQGRIPALDSGTTDNRYSVTTKSLYLSS